MQNTKLVLYGGINGFSDKLRTLVRDIRPHWLLEELGVPYERKTVDFSKREHKSAEYLKLNPFGKIPALTDGDLSIFESAAICMHLCEKFGKLLPKAGTREHTQALSWIFAITTTLEPHLTRVFAAEQLYPEEDAQKEVLENSKKILGPLLKVYQSHFETNQYILGNAFSVVDILTTCALLYVKDSPLLETTPQVRAYIDRCTARPACKKVLALNGVT